MHIDYKAVFRLLVPYLTYRKSVSSLKIILHRNVRNVYSPRIVYFLTKQKPRYSASEMPWLHFSSSTNSYYPSWQGSAQLPVTNSLQQNRMINARRCMQMLQEISAKSALCKWIPTIQGAFEKSVYLPYNSLTLYKTIKLIYSER